MKQHIGLIAASLVALCLASCASVTVSDYSAERPKFDMKQYFNGKLVAHGIIQDRSGKVTRRMVVNMNASWQGDVLTLDEDFTYSDEKKEKRVWTIRKNGDRYIGTAPDVVGEAIGDAAGNALNWKYVLALNVDGSTYNLDFDDWMWQIDDKVMINRAAFSKFGFKLGEVLISFTKAP
jgi:hypothetical protein